MQWRLRDVEVVVGVGVVVAAANFRLGSRAASRVFLHRTTLRRVLRGRAHVACGVRFCLFVYLPTQVLGT